MRQKTRLTLAVPSMIMLFTLSGCAGGAGWGVRLPWGSGTRERQASQATVHDPFPLADIGPEVVGGRPREFQTPLAEPARNNAHQTRPYGYRPQ